MGDKMKKSKIKAFKTKVNAFDYRTYFYISLTAAVVLLMVAVSLFAALRNDSFSATGEAYRFSTFYENQYKVSRVIENTAQIRTQNPGVTTFVGSVCKGYCVAMIVPGCIDETALNYDSKATLNDCSCEYE